MPPQCAPDIYIYIYINIKSNLDSFLISEPILAGILDEYLSSYTIKRSKNLLHHELRGKRNVRMANNAKKMIKVIKEHNEGNIFEGDIPVCNILTKYVPSNVLRKKYAIELLLVKL